MKLIKQPNNWSCMAVAAAMILDVTLEEIYGWIGHDGSAIIHPDLPEPQNRKGFHSQEIVDVMDQFGFSMTPIEVEPWQTPNNVHEYKIEKWGLFINNKSRLKYYLKYFFGILEGKAKEHWHAVAWDGEKIYDSNGTIYPFADCKIDIQIFWKIKSF